MFDNEQARDAFRDLPAVIASLDAVPDAVPDSVSGLLVYTGRGGGPGAALPTPSPPHTSRRCRRTGRTSPPAPRPDPPLESSLSSEHALNYARCMPAVAASRTVFQSSALSRSSAEVFAAATEHPVQVTRRDGEPLVLMSEREDQSRTSLLELASQLIAVSTSIEGTLTERMSDRFPWMLALNAADREACATAILAAARASFATNQPHLAVAELTAWKETATALAAGLGHTPVEWIDDEAVERP